MSLIKSNFPAISQLSDFFDDDWMKTRFSFPDWTPSVNVIDNDDNFEVELAAPGFDKDDFNITVENGVLSIEASTEKEEEEKNKNYTRKEFSSKSFQKRFTLPGNVDEDSVEANYDKGVLKLRITKAEKELPQKKRVAIN